MSSPKVSSETIDALCQHCGQAFSVFLHEMADKNAKVVCPNCRGVNCKPAKTTRLGAGVLASRKTH